MKDINKINENVAKYAKISFLKDLMVEYGLLKEESNKLRDKLLNFTHLDLELEEETKYSKRVSVWLDFITTVYVMFDREPLLLTESDGVPSVRHIIGNLFYWGDLPKDSDMLDGVPLVELV